MARTTLVDDEEHGLATPDEHSDHDPMIDTQETPAQGSPHDARPSGRALYVPSPLPMGELKQALARAREEEELSAAPTNRPPPPDFVPGAPVDVAPAPLSSPAVHSPPPDLEKKIDQRFASVVDSEEARSVGARVNARAMAIAAAMRAKASAPPPLEPLVPVVQPANGVAGEAAKATPPKRGWLGTFFLFLVVLVLGGAAIAAALGKLTKDDARKAMSSVRGVAVSIARSL